MASYSDTAFLTDAFSVAAYDFGAAPPPPVVTNDGGRLRKRLPEDIEREQRLVNDYLDALDRVQLKKEQRGPARQVKAAEKAVPLLTQAMLHAANERQIQEILEGAAVERDRQLAKAEYKRRYVAAFITLMLSD